MLNTTRTRLPPASRAVFRLTTIRRLVTTGYVEPERPAGNSKEIDFEERAGTRVFTLNRPKALNALSWDMFYTLMKRADVSKPASPSLPATNGRNGATTRPSRWSSAWAKGAPSPPAATSSVRI